MKKWIKILIGIAATPVILLILLFVVYFLMNRQGVIDAYTVGNPAAEKRILVASQGSEFKEHLVAMLVKKYGNERTYISVVDCTDLDELDESRWDAVLILHTMQVHKMPAAARRFLHRMTDPSRVMLVCTSGGGDEIVTGFSVDAISSPSRLSRVPQVMDWIGGRMNAKLFTGKQTARDT